MLFYWRDVVTRAAIESWRTVTGLQTLPQIALVVAPLLIAGVVYVIRHGWATMRQEHARPLFYLAIAYLVCVVALFGFNVLQIPSVLQGETSKVDFDFLRQQSGSHDICLAPPGSSTEDKLRAEIADLQRELADAKRQRPQQVISVTPSGLTAEQCDTLATLSRSGRALVDEFIKTRAAEPTRQKISVWYDVTCAQLSKSRCEAFLGAARFGQVLLNFPMASQGDYQILQGRVNYLADRLGTWCP